MSTKPPQSTPRTRNGRWVAGGPSPNPGGRKSDRELTELARARAPEAIEALARVAAGRGLAAVRAAEAILDRALGKPQQSMHVTAARAGQLPEEFVGAAAGILERALAEAERTDADPADLSASVHQTVALGEERSDNASRFAVLDVTAEPVPADRGQSVAKGTGGGSHVNRYPLDGGRELQVTRVAGLAVVSVVAGDRCTSGPLAVPEADLDTLRSALADLAGETGQTEATP